MKTNIQLILVNHSEVLDSFSDRIDAVKWAKHLDTVCTILEDGIVIGVYSPMSGLTAVGQSRLFSPVSF